MSAAGTTSTLLTTSPLIVIPRIRVAHLARRGRIAGQLDTACLAPSAGVDLRLDDDRASDSAGNRLHLVWRRGDITVRHRNTGRLEQCPGLIFVQIHHYLVAEFLTQGVNIRCRAPCHATQSPLR